MKTLDQWLVELGKTGDCRLTKQQIRAIQKDVIDEVIEVLVTHEFPLFFRGNRRGAVTVPTEMDEADFGLLQTQVANMLSTVRTALVVRPIAADPTPGPAPAGE